MRRISDEGEKPRACRRCARFSRKVARRSSARMLPSSSITPWSRTISRLMMRWVALQVGELARQVLQLLIGNDADLRVFQRHGIAGVTVGADAVQPEQLARHLEAGDLVPPVFGRHPGLEEARAHRIDRL